MASRADEYRRLAHQCLDVARTISNEEGRVTLVQMAEVWLRLAEEQETASSLGGIEQPRSTHPSPSVQQQQQTQPEDDDKKE